MKRITVSIHPPSAVGGAFVAGTALLLAGMSWEPLAEPPQSLTVDGALRSALSPEQTAILNHMSFVYLSDDFGRTIAANLQNDVRSATPSVAIGDELWCAWAPSDCVLLDA